MEKILKSMGLNTLNFQIDRLIEYWKAQNIEIASKSNLEIEVIEANKQIYLPHDFRILYSKVNGMPNFFPNEIDCEGFLFYPAEMLISDKDEIRHINFRRGKQVIHICRIYA